MGKTQSLRLSVSVSVSVPVSVTLLSVDQRVSPLSMVHSPDIFFSCFSAVSDPIWFRCCLQSYRSIPNRPVSSSLSRTPTQGSLAHTY